MAHSADPFVADPFVADPFVADPLLPHWLLTGLCWFLGVEFMLFAPLKFSPRGIGAWPSYLVKFRNWGFPSWLAFVVGAGELAAGILLLLPSRRFLGAAIVIVTMVGAMVTHQINRDKPADSISAPIHFALAVIVALSAWPADWRDPVTACAPNRGYAISSTLDSAGHLYCGSRWPTARSRTPPSQGL
jgi:uncharacterized membrane protein YphA (DoxX/SURF4 family)